jgi:hypothetical protein
MAELVEGTVVAGSKHRTMKTFGHVEVKLHAFLMSAEKFTVWETHTYWIKIANFFGHDLLSEFNKNTTPWRLNFFRLRAKPNLSDSIDRDSPDLRR